jgi:hypothetical protein
MVSWQYKVEGGVLSAYLVRRALTTSDADITSKLKRFTYFVRVRGVSRIRLCSYGHFPAARGGLIRAHVVRSVYRDAVPGAFVPDVRQGWK